MADSHEFCLRLVVLLGCCFVTCHSVCEQLSVSGIENHSSRSGTYSIRSDFYDCSGKRSYSENGHFNATEEYRAYFFFFIYPDGRRAWLLGTRPCGDRGTLILRGKDDTASPDKVDDESWYEIDDVTTEWKLSKTVRVECEDNKTLTNWKTIVIVICVVVVAVVVLVLLIRYRTKKDRQKAREKAIGTVSGELEPPDLSHYNSAVSQYKAPNSSSYPTPTGYPAPAPTGYPAESPEGYEQRKDTGSFSGSVHSRTSSNAEISRQTSV